MEVVRYRPGEAIRWLQAGAERDRRSAQSKSRSLVGQTGTAQRPFTDNVRTAASALLDYGRGAYTDVLHSQANAREYVLQEDRFDIVSGGAIKSITYDRVKQIELRGDRAELTLDKGALAIRPFAHIVAGRSRVPVGWQRNGVEVPFDLLIEELAARCKVEVELP